MSEDSRLLEDSRREKNWKRWGPYLSERQWGTVREDYSSDGDCWNYFPHDHARSRAYRWGEDGLLGITDRQCRLCVCLGLWNGKDKILKERLFGLTGPQGNHGEDVKELYYYLDSTPTHSYMKALYKYPQAEYPYAWLEEENRTRGVQQPEFEVEDTGVFNEGRYWDVFAEYAKNAPDDILCKYTLINRGPDTATIHILPTVWYRNTWIWGCTHEGCTRKPHFHKKSKMKIEGNHETLGKTTCEFSISSQESGPKLIFTENETNSSKLFGVDNYTPFVKDAFHRYTIEGDKDAVNPKERGTKVAAHYVFTLGPGEEAVVKMRLYPSENPPKDSFSKEEFDEVFSKRKKEADEFYAKNIPNKCPEERNIARQAYAGLLWSKQFYHYIVKDWLQGDPEQPPPPENRNLGRNSDWNHLFNRDVVSMPDKWEYPWYASWDLAFHMLAFANIDRAFMKDQLLLFLREWYMHPNGQIPAYEFALGDVNPPVHVLAVMKAWNCSGPRGSRDNLFLARCFQKLLLNFTWWVNRKDPSGKNLFSGGFLGLDNIGVFDRSKPPPEGMELNQADGTAWMAVFSLIMLHMALELAETDPSYEDMASKFFEHFISIVDAMNNFGSTGLWDEEDGFYYDSLTASGKTFPLRIRSWVGIVPIFSCLVLKDERIRKLPGFYQRTQWFLKNRSDLGDQISFMAKGEGEKKNSLMLAVPTKEQLVKMLSYILDEEEFLSPYGIRSLSKVHEKHPYIFNMNGEENRVQYVSGESNTYLFGGNSNWRGPIWLPMNYMLIEVLQRYDYYYGENLKVECPTGSGNKMRLKDVSMEICKRLNKLFLPDENGCRPSHGDSKFYAQDPNFKDLVLFYEYFDGDTGRGCGASHQTGWTALIVNCLKYAAGENVFKT